MRRCHIHDNLFRSQAERKKGRAHIHCAAYLSNHSLSCTACDISLVALKIPSFVLHSSSVFTLVVLPIGHKSDSSECSSNSKFSIISHLQERMQSLLNHGTSCTSTDHSPQPRVVDLLAQIRPERVLLLPVLLQIGVLLGAAD